MACSPFGTVMLFGWNIHCTSPSSNSKFLFLANFKYYIIHQSICLTPEWKMFSAENYLCIFVCFFRSPKRITYRDKKHDKLGDAYRPFGTIRRSLRRLFPFGSIRRRCFAMCATHQMRRHTPWATQRKPYVCTPCVAQHTLRFHTKHLPRFFA